MPARENIPRWHSCQCRGRAPRVGPPSVAADGPSATGDGSARTHAEAHSQPVGTEAPLTPNPFSTRQGGPTRQERALSWRLSTDRPRCRCSWCWSCSPRGSCWGERRREKSLPRGWLPMRLTRQPRVLARQLTREPRQSTLRCVGMSRSAPCTNCWHTRPTAAWDHHAQLFLPLLLLKLHHG